MARGASLTLDLISQTSFSLSSTFHSHSRPQSPRSFWPVAGIESYGRTRFSEYAQSIRFVFSTNQIRWEVRESWTSGVRPSQSSRSLPQARRIVGSGDENAVWPVPYACAQPRQGRNSCPLAVAVRMRKALARPWIGVECVTCFYCCFLHFLRIAKKELLDFIPFLS